MSGAGSRGRSAAGRVADGPGQSWPGRGAPGPAVVTGRRSGHTGTTLRVITVTPQHRPNPSLRGAAARPADRREPAEVNDTPEQPPAGGESVQPTGADSAEPVEQSPEPAPEPPADGQAPGVPGRLDRAGLPGGGHGPGAGHGRRAEDRQRPPRHGDEPGPGRLHALPAAPAARPGATPAGSAGTASCCPPGTPA